MVSSSSPQRKVPAENNRELQQFYWMKQAARIVDMANSEEYSNYASAATGQSVLTEIMTQIGIEKF